MRSALPLALLALAACKADAPASNAAAASSSSAKPAQTMAVAPSTSAASAIPATDHVALARAWVEAMANGDSSKGQPKLGAKLAAALKPADVDKAWQTASKGAAFVGIDSTSQASVDGYDVVTVHVKCDGGVLDARLPFDPKTNEVVGLHISDLDTWTAPEYVDASKFDETEVAVGDGAKALPGTLAMPKGDGPFPGLFLVHGSGPNDRDESTHGGAKPFRDLARGLASQGIAVLRYEKRTYGGHVKALATDPAEMGLKEEYYDDVAAAGALLRATNRIDPKKVYVLGHSEGGFLVPQFLANDPALAGGVIFSGNARPFFDLLVPQFTYLAKFTPDQAGAKAAIDDIKKKIAKAKDPKLDKKTPPSELPLGLPPAYCISVRDYDPVAVAKKETRPLLITQGERDYQVTPADDFALWKKSLTGKNVTFKLYPKLNHDYFAGEGEIGPDEYMSKSGHVPAEVVDDLAAFLGAK